jgi:SsrA-binding protein
MSKAKDKAGTPGELLVCRNPKAQHDFEIAEKFEAGMVLTGSEVKSLRARRADLEGAYATVDGAELFLHHMHIAPYEQAGPFGHEPRRSRKLLAHREEIQKLLGQLAHRGYTLVPLRVYFKNGRAKVELALGKGKRRADRREDLKRDIDLREAREAMGRGKR